MHINISSQYQAEKGICERSHINVFLGRRFFWTCRSVIGIPYFGLKFYEWIKRFPRQHASAHFGSITGAFGGEHDGLVMFPSSGQKVLSAIPSVLLGQFWLENVLWWVMYWIPQIEACFLLQHLIGWGSLDTSLEPCDAAWIYWEYMLRGLETHLVTIVGPPCSSTSHFQTILLYCLGNNVALNSQALTDSFSYAQVLYGVLPFVAWLFLSLLWRCKLSFWNTFCGCHHQTYWTPPACSYGLRCQCQQFVSIMSFSRAGLQRGTIFNKMGVFAWLATAVCLTTTTAVESCCCVHSTSSLADTAIQL